MSPQQLEHIGYQRLKEQRDNLLHALMWLHPKAGVWRTPDDLNAEWIEKSISQARGDYV